MSTRIPFKNRLIDLDISQGDFDYYVQLFIVNYTRYWIRHDYSSSWFMAKSKTGIIPLNKYTVARHLQNEFWVSKQMSGRTGFFCIDLDNSGKIPLLIRYLKILEVLPNPVVLRSSNSGGLHLYYILKQVEWRNNGEIFNRCRETAFNSLQTTFGYLIIT